MTITKKQSSAACWMTLCLAISAATGAFTAEAFAADENVSVATEQTTWRERARERWNVSLYSRFENLDSKAPLSGMSPNLETGMTSDSDTAVGKTFVRGFYKTTPNTRIGLESGINHSLAATSTQSVATSVAIRDTLVRVENSKVFATGPLSFSSDLRVVIPTSSRSQASNLLMGFATYHSANLSLGRSPFSLSLGLYGQLNTFRGPSAGDAVSYFINPGVNAQILPNLGVSLAYEADGKHGRDADLTHFVNDGDKVDLGVSWDPTNYLNISPFLELQALPASSTGNMLNTATINLWLSLALI